MAYDKNYAESIFLGKAGRDYRVMPKQNSRLAHQIGDYQTPYALDEEVVDELMYLPYATIYGKDERPYSPKTLAEAFEIYTFEAISENEKLAS